MLNFKKVFTIRLISLIVAVTFSVTSSAYSIDISDKSLLRTPLLASSDEGVSRLRQALLYQLRQMLGQVVKVDTTEELEFYSSTKSALLLENGKILLGGKLYSKYNSEDPEERADALSVIIHETIEALLQVTKKNHPSRYQSVKELALNHLAELYFLIPQADPSYRDETLANDIWAVAFEYRLMGISPEDVRDPSLSAFLSEAYEIIQSRGELFGEEFTSPYRAKESVVEALRRGFRFKRAADSETNAPVVAQDSEPLISSFMQGGINNVFYIDRHAEESAHIQFDNKGRYVSVSFPTGNAGACAVIKSPSGEPGIDVLDSSVRSVADGEGAFHGVEFKVGSKASELVLVPELGNMRDIRNLTRGSADPLTYREMQMWGGYLFAEPDVAENEKGEVEARLRVTTQGGRHVHNLVFRFPKGTKVMPGKAKRKVFVEAGEDMEFDTYPMRVTAPKGETVTWTMEATMDFEPLTLWGMGDIFEPSVFKELEEMEPGPARQFLWMALKAAEFLIHPEAIHAGSNQFLTYFGRDTILWIWMFLINERISGRRTLKPEVYFTAVSSVLERVNKRGEVAHEEDLRWPRSAEERFDYRMVDGDFMLAGLLSEYSETIGAEDKARLLGQVNSRGDSYLLSVLRNFNLVLERALPYSEHIGESKADAYKRLIHLKNEEDPTGNWRDSLNGLARAYYPFDVNAIWAPKALEAIREMLLDPDLRPLLEEEIAKHPGEFAWLRKIFDDLDSLERSEGHWQNVGQRFFMVNLDVDEWQQRLVSFYGWAGRKEAGEEDAELSHKLSETLLREKVGVDAEGQYVTAEDFVYNGRVPTWAEDGFSYYGLALDRQGNLVEAPNTDTAFWLLSSELPHAAARRLMQSLFVPASLGGMFLSEVGIITSNPMLARQRLEDPLMTDLEKKRAASPKPLWALTDGTEYHWFVVWGFKLAMIEIGLMHQLENLAQDARSPPDALQRTWAALQKVRKSVEYNIGVQNQEVVTWKINPDGSFSVEPLGSRGRGTIVSNPYQLWNTAEIAVRLGMTDAEGLARDIGITSEEEDYAVDLLRRPPAAGLGPGTRGAIGKYSIEEVSYDPQRNALSVRFIDIEEPQKGIQSLRINAQRAPPGLINETLQHLMTLSSDPIVGRIVRWYTEEFVRTGRIVIIEDNKKDILGLGERDIVAVSRRLIDNPIALFHEIAHAYLDAHPEELTRIESQLTKGRIRWVNSKDRSLRPHYILRAFQRQIFGNQDRYLTQLINDIYEVRSAASQGDLFYLGDNVIDIAQLIPLAEALEDALSRIDDVRVGDMLSGGLSVDVGGYSVDNPGEHLLDIVIRDESGSEIAKIKIWPLKKADGISYDGDAVFLEWFGIEPSWMKGKGLAGPMLYQALAGLLSDLGYKEVYAHIKWGSDNFWKKMGWESTGDNVYIPGSLPGFYIDKPDAVRGACPTVARLRKGRITDAFGISDSGADTGDLADIRPPAVGHVEPVADSYTALRRGEYDEAYDLLMDGLLGEDFVVNVETALGIMRTLIGHYGKDNPRSRELAAMLPIAAKHQEAADQTEMKRELRQAADRERKVADTGDTLKERAPAVKLIAVDFGGTLTPTNSGIIAVDDFLLACLSAMEMLLIADLDLNIDIVSGGPVEEDISGVLELFPSRFHMLRTSGRFNVNERISDKRRWAEEALRERGLPEDSLIVIGDSENTDAPMALGKGYFARIYPHTRRISPDALEILSFILEAKGRTVQPPAVGHVEPVAETEGVLGADYAVSESEIMGNAESFVVAFEAGRIRYPLETEGLNYTSFILDVIERLVEGVNGRARETSPLFDISGGTGDRAARPRIERITVLSRGSLANNRWMLGSDIDGMVVYTNMEIPSGLKRWFSSALQQNGMMLNRDSVIRWEVVSDAVPAETGPDHVAIYEEGKIVHPVTRSTRSNAGLESAEGTWRLNRNRLFRYWSDGTLSQDEKGLLSELHRSAAINIISQMKMDFIVPGSERERISALLEGLQRKGLVLLVEDYVFLSWLKAGDGALRVVFQGDAVGEGLQLANGMLRDLGRVRQLLSQSLHPEMVSMLMRTWRNWLKTDPDKVIFLVNKEEGMVQGFCFGRVQTGDIYNVSQVAVDVSRQGQGIGRALFNAFIDEVERRGARGYNISVDARENRWGTRLAASVAEERGYESVGGDYVKIASSGAESAAAAIPAEAPRPELQPGERIEIGGREFEVLEPMQDSGYFVYKARDLSGDAVMLKFQHDEGKSAYERDFYAQVPPHANITRGYSLEDEAGNILNVVYFIEGKTLLNHLFDLDMDHRTFYERVFPGLLEGFIGAVRASEHVLGYGFYHESVPHHILVEEGTGRFVLFDFNLPPERLGVPRGSHDIELRAISNMGECLGHIIEMGRPYRPAKGVTLKDYYPYVSDDLSRILGRLVKDSPDPYTDMAELRGDLERLSSSIVRPPAALETASAGRRQDTERVSSDTVNLNELEQTTVFFSGEHVMVRPDAFRQALDELSDTNAVVVITDARRELLDFCIDEGIDVGRFFIRTPEELGLAGFDLNQAMTLIKGIDNLKCIPLTDSIGEQFPALIAAQGNV